MCREAGIDLGRIDGLFGPLTEFAFMEFNRRKHGLPAPEPIETILDKPFEPFSPNVTQSTQWPREKDLPSVFGDPCKVKLVRLRLPFHMHIAWDLSKTVSSFSIHEKCHDSAARAFQKITETYSMDEIKDLGRNIFSGCYHCRKKSGGTSWSTHAWGIAIDFDDTRNKLKWNHTEARLARSDAIPFWRIWEEEGWVSLGRARDFDWMHVQAARLNSM